MQQRTFTLLLTDVESALPIGAECPALQTLLSKATRRSAAPDASAFLFDAFSIDVDVDGDWPVGAVSALGDGLDALSGWWLRVDPVHMVADRDQLYLSAYETLSLSQDDANELVAELNALYEDEAWHFTAVTPQRWYLCLPQSLTMRTTATKVAMGRRVGEVLPQGDDALGWQRVMTEIQMLLHASSVNARRSDAGLLAVNSLWFWGGGSLPGASGQPDFDLVVSSEPLALGLAKLCDVERQEVAPAAVARVNKGSNMLWQTPMGTPELTETQLFQPLLGMLQRGELSEVVIEMPGIASWRIERKALRRWWRRRKPLSMLLKVSE